MAAFGEMASKIHLSLFVWHLIIAVAKWLFSRCYLINYLCWWDQSATCGLHLLHVMHNFTPPPKSLPREIIRSGVKRRSLSEASHDLGLCRQHWLAPPPDFASRISASSPWLCPYFGISHSAGENNLHSFYSSSPSSPSTPSRTGMERTSSAQSFDNRHWPINHTMLLSCNRSINWHNKNCIYERSRYCNRKGESSSAEMAKNLFQAEDKGAENITQIHSGASR